LVPHPKTAVAGHKKAGTPDTPDTIEASKRHLTDVGRLKESNPSDRELHDALTEPSPDRAGHQAWLPFGFQPKEQ
jgi:hypothetical protein